MTSLIQIVWTSINISQKFVLKGSIVRQQAIVLANDGSLNDAYMRHSVSMCYWSDCCSKYSFYFGNVLV